MAGRTRIADQGVTRNKYRVPPKQWRKWCLKARVAFNHLYSLMMKNQDLFRHPKAIKENPRLWKTTAWNAAWIAAGSVHDALPRMYQEVR